MKQFKPTIYALLVLSALLLVAMCTPVPAQTGYLHIKGNTINTMARTINAIMIVIDKTDNVSDTIFVKGEFNKKLALNHLYSIKFTNPFCKDKEIIIDTKCYNNENKYVFEFNIELETIGNTPGIPVAYVYFDKKSKTFDYLIVSNK